MSNKKKGIILSYINLILSTISGLFLSSLYIRQLGATEYGVYETISSFINYLVILQVGTGSVMTRNLSIIFAKENKNQIDVKKNISSICGITVFLSMVILIISIIFYFLIDDIYYKSMTIQQIATSKNIFIFLVIYLIISFYSQTITGIILAYENYTLSSKISIARLIIKLLIITFLILSFKKAIYIAIVDSILSIFIFVYELFYCKEKYNVSFSLRYIDKKVIKSTMPFCFAILLQGIINQANSNVDKFALGVMMSPKFVTIYSISLYIQSMFYSLSAVPLSIYSPQIMKNVAKGLKEKKLADTLIEPSRLTMLIGGMVFFGFISVGRQFITIVYGKEYVESWIYAIIIMIPSYINMSNECMLSVLDVINKRIIRSIGLLITTVLNVILTILWIKKFGILGASLATMICGIIGQTIFMNIYYYKKLKIPVFYMFKETIKGILKFQVIAAICVFPLFYYISNPIISFFTMGIIFVLIFLFGFIKHGKNNYENNFMISIRQYMQKGVKNINFLKNR